MKQSKSNKKSILSFAQLSILLALEIIVCFTPLGTLPALGPLSATLSHIPVIITTVILGIKAGTFMGFSFGMCSFLYWSFFAPGLFSFIYTPLYSLGEFKGNFFSIIICFLPRILIGPVAYLVYNLLKKTKIKDNVSLFIAGFFGSMTNTVLVLGGISVFFSEQYITAIGGATKGIFAILATTLLFNGIPEAILGGLAAVFIAKPVKNAIGKMKFRA